MTHLRLVAEASEVAEAPGRALDLQAVRETWSYERRRPQAIISAGQALTRLKAGCRHGGWLPLLASVGIPDRTARDWMRAGKSATVADLEEHGLRGWLKRTRSARAGTGDNRGDPRTDEWYTPAVLIEAAREAMGGIDLDPASCDTAQATVRAGRYFTREDNGLAWPLGAEWSGNVWLNPPFSGRLKEYFLTALKIHHRLGNVPQACVLTFTDTSPRWAEPLHDVTTATCLIRGRVEFHSDVLTHHPPGMGCTVAYVGPRVTRFLSAFIPLGNVSLTVPGLRHFFDGDE